MKFEEELKKYSIEKIREVPKKICELLILNSLEYTILEKESKDVLDTELINFKKSKDYVGFYKKDEFRIYVKSAWLSKTVCERRIIDFLKGSK